MSNQSDLFRKLVAAVPIKAQTLDLVERLLKLERKSEVVESVQVHLVYGPRGLTWDEFDQKYGAISIYVMLNTEFRSLRRLTSFLADQNLPTEELIESAGQPAESTRKYYLLRDNVQASFAKPYTKEREALLHYSQVHYPEWYFEKKRK